MALKYKVGDRVKIKSLDWYNENKDEFNQVKCSNRIFTYPMTKLCGKTVTIRCVNDKDCYYVIYEDGGYNSWTDEMIEGLVEEEVGLVDNLSSRWVNEFNLPDGYIFKDENGNIINATKIVLEKKKNEYPKTYEECAKVLLERASVRNDFGYKADLLVALQKLLVCRDAYWKLYGEEMGLGKPWEPSDSDYTTGRYCIFVHRGNIICDTPAQDCVLTFPTPEMRDVFYENFKSDIEFCKELL